MQGTAAVSCRSCRSLATRAPCPGRTRSRWRGRWRTKRWRSSCGGPPAGQNRTARQCVVAPLHSRLRCCATAMQYKRQRSDCGVQGQHPSAGSGSVRFPQELSSECVRIYYLIGCNHRQRQARASCPCADKQAGMWCKRQLIPLLAQLARCAAAPAARQRHMCRQAGSNASKTRWVPPSAQPHTCAPPQ